MIVALLAEKGGTGKTTLATNLAGMRAMRGRRVLLIDADRQGSSHFWAQAGPHLLHVDSEALHGEALGGRLRNPGMRYDDIIVDTGAGDVIEMEASLASADCAVAPLQPSGVDVATMGLVDGRVAQAREYNPGLRALALLNRAPTNPRNRDESEARNALAACTALEVAPTRVCDRVAFARALTAGQTVMDRALARAPVHRGATAARQRAHLRSLADSRQPPPDCFFCCHEREPTEGLSAPGRRATNPDGEHPQGVG